MKKNIVLAVIATAAMALSLVGCGVNVTNISVSDAATLEKGESITLPVNFGTEDAPAETPVIATGESATAETAAQDEKIAKAAEKLMITQPTLSRQLKDLEQELGEPLFIREHIKSLNKENPGISSGFFYCF